MAYDFKKEFRDLYQPKAKPSFVDVPAMTFAAVAGTGDPNEEGGAYSRALELLYAFSYAVKMPKMGDWQPEGYFDYVVPPLEGLWWGGAGAFDGASIADKSALSWVSLIRQPDFVTPESSPRLLEMVAAKKPALADELAEKLAALGVVPDHIEGKTTGWILLDYKSLVVHIFTPAEREQFALEKLWGDAQPVDLSAWVTA